MLLQLLHSETKLSPFDNKEISVALRFRLDKLAILLLTNLPCICSPKVQLDYHLHLFLLQVFQNCLLLKFHFQPPSMDFCMNSLNSLALTTFFHIYFHYYCHGYLNPRGNTSFQNQGRFFSSERCTYKSVCFIIYFIYIFYFVSCILFLIFTLSDFCIPVKHGSLNVFPF